MADLDQLKAKYAPVIQTIEQFSGEGAKVENVGLDGDRLLLKASVPSQVVANRVWDSIKQVDPQFSDLHHEITTTGNGDQTYTIKPGDNLSKVSKLFYGSASHYHVIAKANGIENPDRIQTGQKIKIPTL
jgi:nucleoid-associated protein YgaU